jgi:uncharacterized protein (DUF1499 family)
MAGTGSGIGRATGARGESLPGIARIGVGLTFLGVALLPASALAYRAGLLPVKIALLVFLAGGVLSALGAILCLAGAAASRRATGRRASPVVLLALLLGLAGAGIFLRHFAAARSAPPIHDITTDMANPPAFVTLLPERRNAPHGAAYGGPPVAEQQRNSYPEIRPLLLSATPREAFDRAFRAAKRMGWTIAAADPATGCIEATDTTLWFGFKDDVVVRVSPSGPGSRIDVRSASRLGQGDVGANARRIRCYVRALEGR